MNFTDVCKIANSDKDKALSFYGIVLDELILPPPGNLSEVSIRAEFNNNRLTDDMLDLIIALNLNHTKVIVEVVGDRYDLDTLFSDSANGDFSISFLRDQQSIADYTRLLCEATTQYFKRANFSKMVWPVSGYIQYLFEESLGFTNQIVVTDEYLKTRFFDGWSDDDLDCVKYNLKVVIYSLFANSELETGFCFLPSEVINGIDSAGLMAMSNVMSNIDTSISEEYRLSAYGSAFALGVLSHEKSEEIPNLVKLNGLEMAFKEGLSVAKRAKLEIRNYLGSVGYAVSKRMRDIAKLS